VRAAVCKEYGPPEVVTMQEMPSPELRDREVRVHVTAAGVNFPDVLLVAGEYQIKIPPPFVPGSEFAGVVTGAGGEFPVGARVIGAGIVGAFAEEVVAPAAALRRIPDSIDDRTGAAFGIAYRTAYHALRSVARLRPGEELVVLGAGGGVGLASVQLGVLLGASVTAVASSPEKLAVARACGASHTVDYRAVSDFRGTLKATLPRGADVVIDPVGGELSEPALRALRWGGRFVTVGYASGTIPRIPLNLVLLKGIAVLGFEFGGFALRNTDEFHRNEDDLFELFATGRVVPYVGAAFPLANAAAALRHVADGKAIGKVVIDV
jgi:NADPH2:quinone reductase